MPDPGARLPGRGAWIHEARDCFDAAIAGRGFQRAFRAPVTIPDDTKEFAKRTFK